MYFGQQKSCATSIFLTMFITLIVICGFCSFLLGIILFIDSGYSGCDYDKGMEDDLDSNNKDLCKDKDDYESCISVEGIDINGVPVSHCRYRPSFIDIIVGKFSNDDD